MMMNDEVDGVFSVLKLGKEACCVGFVDCLVSLLIVDECLEMVKLAMAQLELGKWSCIEENDEARLNI